MLRKSIAIALTMLIALVANVSAQTAEGSFRLQGVLVDSLTREGEPYATVSVTRATAPDKPVVRQLTDSSGRFELSVQGSGDYVLTLSAKVGDRSSGGSAFGTVKSGKLTLSARTGHYQFDKIGDFFGKKF